MINKKERELLSLTLGLDIGIASVGWALINPDEQKIVDGGVRLFPVGTAEANQERRIKRGIRRGKRRRQQRLKELLDLCREYQLPDLVESSENPYALRVKGLTQPLTPEDLTVALYHLLKHRGISYLSDESLELLSLEEGSDSDALKWNLNALKTAHVCEIQWERYQRYGRCRGVFKAEDSGLLLSNTFPNQAYLKEATQLITCQQAYHSQLDASFLTCYLELLQRKRPYYVGPGNEKSRTDYGIYRTNGETLTHLYADLIGKCSLFPKESRVSIFSKKAQLYNFLTDLNNLTWDGEKLSLEEKTAIYKELLQRKQVEKDVPFLKRLAKTKGLTLEALQGYRRTSNGDPLCNHLEPYLRLKQALLKADASFQLETLTDEQMERLAYLMTLNEDPEALNEVLHQEVWLPKGWIPTLLEFRSQHKAFFSKWHAYSEKALDILLPVLWEFPYNQMQALKHLNLSSSTLQKKAKSKYLRIEDLTEEIYNPVTRRAVQEAVKVVNAVLKRYGALDYLVVEMARDWNDKEDKRGIEKRQKEHADKKRRAFTEASVEYSDWAAARSLDDQLALKVQLWYEQGQHCLYSGERIAIKDLVHAPHLFEVDHIIPLSVSFDDSRQNKVLCLSVENQQKGQRSPYDYFMETQGKGGYQSFKERVLDTYQDGKGELPLGKKALLLCEDSLTKYETRLMFKNRNLNDTRYASREVFNGLQDWVQTNELKTRVIPVRGKFTHQLRRRWGFVKDREESHSHHMVDAAIVASVPHLQLFQTLNVLTDEHQVVSSPALLNAMQVQRTFNQLPYETFLVDLEQQISRCRYSYKVDTKANRKLSDETIYTTRTGFLQDAKTKEFIQDPRSTDVYVVEKYKNIYSKEEGAKVFKRLKEKPSSFLMFHYQPKAFQALLDALAPYQKEANPLLSYYQDNGPLHVVSKRGVATPVLQLKYLANQFNQGIQIQSHYPTQKQIALCSTNPWRTDVYYNRRTGNYQCVGIRYYRAKFQKGGDYGLSIADYQAVLKDQKQKIDLTQSDIECLLATGEAGDYVFCFSLYKHQCLEYQLKDETDVHRTRHWSFDLASNAMYQRRIDSTDSNKKALPRLNPRKCQQLVKLNIDPLGYEHRIYREKLSLTVNI